MLRKYHKPLDHVLAGLLNLSKGKTEAALQHLQLAMEDKEGFDEALEDLDNANEFAKLAEANPGKLLKTQLSMLTRAFMEDTADEEQPPVEEEDDEVDAQLAKVTTRITASDDNTDDTIEDVEEEEASADEVSEEVEDEGEEDEVDLNEEEEAKHCASVRAERVKQNLAALASLIKSKSEVKAAKAK